MTTDVGLLARVLALSAEIDAIKVEVEGMKATNAEQARRGETLQYGEGSFRGKAHEIRSTASVLEGIWR
jgi:hypothetical protein